MFESSYEIEKMVDFRCDEIKKRVEEQRLKQKLGSSNLISRMVSTRVRAVKNRIGRKR